MATIPLKCSICSDEQIYSDVSHLLTHMSSKRHLSTQFKATVRARQDPILAQKLGEFEQWYNETNVAGLLAERLAKKDERNLEANIARVKRRRTKRVKDEDIDGKITLEHDTYCSLKNRRYIIANIPIDPDMLVKEEPGLYSEYQDESLSADSEQLLFYDQSYQDPNASWLSHESSLDDQVEPHSQLTHSWLHEHSQSYTVNDNSYGHSCFGSTGLDPQDDLLHKLEDSSKDAEGDVDHEFCSSPTKTKHTKLKGIIWPGMRLFDAASPEGIRMRNQKKKYEISGMLQRSSQQTQPTEIVYYAGTWTLKEDRPIDGEVHSPPPEDLSPPVKRAKRKILAEKSTNPTVKKGTRRKVLHARVSKVSDIENGGASSAPCSQGRQHVDYEQHDSDTLLDEGDLYGSPTKPTNSHRQHNKHEYRLQTGTYPFLSNHSSKHAKSALGKTLQSTDQERSDFPCYFGHEGMLHNISLLRQPVFVPENSRTFSPLTRQRLDEIDNRVLPGLDRPLGAARNHQTLPSIGFFGHLYSSSRQEEYGYHHTRPFVSARDLPAETQDRAQSPAFPLLHTVYPRLNEPRVSIKREYENESMQQENTYEDSSGDETIDQNIDSPPARYFTRSAIRKIEGDLF